MFLMLDSLLLCLLTNQRTLQKYNILIKCVLVRSVVVAGVWCRRGKSVQGAACDNYHAYACIYSKDRPNKHIHFRICGHRKNCKI